VSRVEVLPRVKSLVSACNRSSAKDLDGVTDVGEAMLGGDFCRHSSTSWPLPRRWNHSDGTLNVVVVL